MPETDPPAADDPASAPRRGSAPDGARAAPFPSPPPGSFGRLLVARETLDDPNFKSAIVLLCHHGVDGAYGLVLNRPAHMPLREIFERPPGDGGLPRRVYIGGPVQPTELQILQVGEAFAPGAMEVAPGVGMGGTWETLEEILAPDPETVRLFLGYSGWGEGQLDAEIEAGAWEIREVDLRRLLETPEALWAAGPDQLRRFLAAS